MSESDTDKKRVYLNRLDDLPDHQLFFLALVIGGGGIALLKFLGAPELLVTAFPITIMFLYAGAAYFTRRFRLRADRVGENLYYLGFLYTLISLGISLIELAKLPDATNEIIANFGIAIFTTIVGLSFRVIFFQLREDPVEYEREARMELADAANAFRDILRDSTNNFELFKDGLAQRVDEGVTDMVSKASGSMETVVAKFAGVGSNVLEKIEEAFKTFTDHSRRLNAISAGTVEALETLLQRVNSIDTSPDLISKKFEPVIAQLSTVATEMGGFLSDQAKASKHIKQYAETTLKALQESTGPSNELSEKLQRQVRQMQESTERLVVVFGQLEGKLHGFESTLVPGIDQAYKALQTIRASIAADVDAVRKHRDELEALMNSSRTMVGEVHRSMSGLAQSIVERVDGR